jgi:hypothetical protein
MTQSYADRMRNICYFDITKAQDDLAEIEAAYLKRYGWEYTCATPGSRWLWQRTMDDGRTLMAHADDAIEITRNEIAPREQQ